MPLNPNLNKKTEQSFGIKSKVNGKYSSVQFALIILEAVLYRFLLSASVVKFSYQKLHGPSYEWLDGMKPIGSPIILRMRNHAVVTTVLPSTVMIETVSYNRW